MVRLM